MNDRTPIRVVGAGEGDTDWDVIRRLVGDAGARVGPLHGGQGKDRLRAGLRGYREAARFEPWFVLTDLDHEADCAPELVRHLLPGKGPGALCLRIPVHAVEAWLLADASRVAHFLGIAEARGPGRPEDVDHPKLALVNLARRSRKRLIREGLVPSSTSGRAVGPAYSSLLRQYIHDTAGGWRPAVAAENSPSLAGAIEALRRLVP